MKMATIKKLSPEAQAALDAVRDRPDDQINRTDADCPPTTEEDWKGAVRGALFRGKKPYKRSLTLRLDADVLEWFRQSGEGYQTRMNAALREFMSHHRENPGKR